MSVLIELREKLNIIRRDKRGQSFIEAMVAITIIVSSITSALALVQSSITASRVSGSQVIAANLSREGLEVVRSLRDSNWLKGQSFQVGLVQGTSKVARPILDISTGTWSLDFTPVTIDDDAAKLYIKQEGAYIQANSQPLGSRSVPYKRILVLDHICRNDVTGVEKIETGISTCTSGSETLVGLAVKATTSFLGASSSIQLVEVEERLYDWR